MFFNAHISWYKQSQHLVGSKAVQCPKHTCVHHWPLGKALEILISLYTSLVANLAYCTLWSIKSNTLLNTRLSSPAYSIPGTFACI